MGPTWVRVGGVSRSFAPNKRAQESPSRRTYAAHEEGFKRPCSRVKPCTTARKEARRPLLRLAYFTPATARLPTTGGTRRRLRDRALRSRRVLRSRMAVRAASTLVDYTHSTHPPQCTGRTHAPRSRHTHARHAQPHARHPHPPTLHPLRTHTAHTVSLTRSLLAGAQTYSSARGSGRACRPCVTRRGRGSWASSGRHSRRCVRACELLRGGSAARPFRRLRSGPWPLPGAFIHEMWVL